MWRVGGQASAFGALMHECNFERVERSQARGCGGGPLRVVKGPTHERGGGGLEGGGQSGYW
jgi:hypothetical protein